MAQRTVAEKAVPERAAAEDLLHKQKQEARPVPNAKSPWCNEQLKTDPRPERCFLGAVDILRAIIASGRNNKIFYSAEKILLAFLFSFGKFSTLHVSVSRRTFSEKLGSGLN